MSDLLFSFEANLTRRLCIDRLYTENTKKKKVKIFKDFMIVQFLLNFIAELDFTWVNDD